MENTPLAPTKPAPDLFVSAKSPLALRVGQILQAIVRENISADTVLLQMRDAMVPAKTNLPLDPGQTLTLKVDTLGNEVRLRVLQGAELADAAKTDVIMAALAKLKSFGPVAAEFDNLANILKALPDAFKKQFPEMDLLGRLLLAPDTLTAETLEKAVLNSGVFFETKLRLLAERTARDAPAGKTDEQALSSDLKGLLLKVRTALDDPDFISRLRDAGVNSGDLGRTVDKLIGNLEFQQLQSKLGDSAQLFLPLLWKGLTDEWIQFKTKKRGATDPSHACTINLDLEHIGKLRSHILLQSGVIHVKVYSDNHAFVAAFRDQQEVLSKQFAGANVKLGGLSITFKRDIDFTEQLPEGLDIRV